MSRKPFLVALLLFGRYAALNIQSAGWFYCLSSCHLCCHAWTTGVQLSQAFPYTCWIISSLFSIQHHASFAELTSTTSTTTFLIIIIIIIIINERHCLQSRDMPTARHFLKRQYWHLLRLRRITRQRPSRKQRYSICFCILRRKKPYQKTWHTHYTPNNIVHLSWYHVYKTGWYPKSLILIIRDRPEYDSLKCGIQNFLISQNSATERLAKL